MPAKKTKEKDLTFMEREVQKVILLKYKEQLINYSRRIWSYMGHTGAMTPWHDDPNKKINLPEQRNAIATLLQWLEAKDISLEAYAMFALTIAEIKNFKSPAMLFPGYNDYPKSWIGKLRKHTESSEKLDLVASVLLRFLELQIEAYGVAEIDRFRVFDRDTRYESGKKNSKCLELYHKLIERVLVLDHLNIDPFLWLETKFQSTLSFFKSKNIEKKVDLVIIVNKNGLDPDLKDLRAVSADPYRLIKAFLGLSPQCEFTDGYIPKGWGPSSDDRDRLSKVKRITGLGYYFYENGTQRRGRRHYAQNSYFVIKCVPENFELFKDTWNDPRLITANPTWEEYSKWGASGGWWDETGKSTNGRGRPVKWRKDGPPKSK